MPLKIKLKAREKLLINGALLTNGPTPSELYIENKVPLLRHKEIMLEQDAETPCQKIYFLIQLMYFAPDNLKELHSLYWKLVRPLVNASPSMIDYVSQISECLLEDKYYPALKLARKLIDYEQKVMSHAQESLQHV